MELEIRSRFVQDHKNYFKRLPKDQVVECVECEGRDAGTKFFYLGKVVEGYWIYIQLGRGPGDHLDQVTVILNPRERGLANQLLFAREDNADERTYGFGSDFGRVRNLRREIIACPPEADNLCRDFLVAFMQKIEDNPAAFLRRAEALKKKEPSTSIHALPGGAPGLGKRA